MMKFNIEKEVGRDVLENIFITALEGGSNYWYYINPKNHKKIRDAVSREDEAFFSMAFAKAILDHDVSIEVHDIEDMEDDTPIGVINYKTIKDGLQKMIDTGDGWALFNEISEQGDAESSDVCFQYMVLGEVIYG
jgi:hypothetical protein